ncbi:MAG: hypothetical protein GXP61_04935 [Epsilonproteobacteria bacterium]|nr:hypothetical protein [Campylobacterota bacterium]
MSDLKIVKPNDAKEIKVEGQTVPFFEYKINDTTYIEFDTSKCGPPEPMVNAMLAVGLIKNKDTKVIMINHKSPAGLLPKINANFNIEEGTIEDGKVKLVFSYKEGMSEKANLDDKSCDG